jgi:hypothetical protein
MSSVTVKRSQAILRMPIDMIDAHLIMHDGDRSDVLMFVPPTEDIVRVMTEGPAFVAIARGGMEAIAARDAIACIGVTPSFGPKLDEDLPIVRQKVAVQLRSGVTLEGELRFVSFASERQLLDFMCTDAPCIAVFTDKTTYVISKAHVSSVIEQ